MTISFVLMGSRELRRLVSTPASDDILPEDTVKCVSIADVILEIENIKKRGRAKGMLGIIRDGKCRFHEATGKGYVYTVTLDANAVQNGLFDTTDSFYDVQFWKPAVDRQTDPAYSVRLASFRAYDLNCGTQFHLEILGLLR